MIPVCGVRLDGNELKYVTDCIETSWISSSGPYVKRFEAAFAEHLGVAHAVAVSSGTAALHVALAALGVGPGDEVIIPSLTMIATANTVAYLGARPVPVDVDPDTGNLDPAAAEAAWTDRTRAIVPVHLYGMPADMDGLIELAAGKGAGVVEDAAEAIGTACAGGPAGAVGDLGAFSFFANKVVTTGEGGMVTTDDAALAESLRRLRDQWFVPERRFHHPKLGYNYRMTNLQAAVGLAQTERIDRLIGARREIAERYRAGLAGCPHLIPPPEAPEGQVNSHWMTAFRVRDGAPLDRDDLMVALRERGVDSRAFFHPMHLQPAFQRDDNPACPKAEQWARTGLLLPTGVTLSRGDQDQVVETLLDLLS